MYGEYRTLKITCPDRVATIGLNRPESEDAVKLIDLVSEALPADQFDAKVDEIVEERLAVGPLAVRMTKRSVNLPRRGMLPSMIEAHLGK